MVGLSDKLRSFFRRDAHREGEGREGSVNAVYEVREHIIARVDVFRRRIGEGFVHAVELHKGDIGADGGGDLLPVRSELIHIVDH